MNKCTPDGEEGPWPSALFSLMVTLSARSYVSYVFVTSIPG